MYKTLEDLNKGIRERLWSDRSVEEVMEEPEIKKIKALWDAYHDAFEEAEKHGWIGVGCITYAENKIQWMQKMNLVNEGENQ